MLQGIVNVVRSKYDNKYSMNSQIIAIIIICLPTENIWSWVAISLIEK